MSKLVRLKDVEKEFISLLRETGDVLELLFFIHVALVYFCEEKLDRKEDQFLKQKLSGVINGLAGIINLD